MGALHNSLRSGHVLRSAGAIRRVSAYYPEQNHVLGNTGVQHSRAVWLHSAGRIVLGSNQQECKALQHMPGLGICGANLRACHTLAVQLEELSNSASSVIGLRRQGVPSGQPQIMNQAYYRCHFTP